jgi:hypothetical protein
MSNVDDHTDDHKGKVHDSVVLLRCHYSRVLAKRYSGGEWTPYDRCRTHDAATAHISRLRDLYQILEQARADRRLCIVRGALVAGEKATGIRRLSAPDPLTDDAPTLRDIGRRWAALDLDQWSVPGDVDRHDLLQCAEAVMPNLPEAFRPAKCIVQATSSHTFKSGVNLRLWFWLDRPLTGAELRRWLRDYDGIDCSVFLPAQPIYTADPVFLDDGVDPLPARLAWLHGQPWVITPTAEELRPPVHEIVGGVYVALSPRRLHGIIRNIVEAPHGERNRRLHWSAARLGEAVRHGDIDDTHAYNILIECARRIDLPEAEILPTIRSGLARGKAGNNFSEFTFESK